MNLSKQQPIGVFDSGIGGLTVAKAIQELLPYEQLLYFGDTVHMPYGEKSNEAIIDYCLRITDYLLSQKVKVIVIACNTASAVAFNAIKTHVKGSLEIINVIGPVLDYIIQKNYTRVGVIATEATIRTKVYEKALVVRDNNIRVHAEPTPLLAPMIESGFFNDKISHSIIDRYLSKEGFQDMETLVLGCTHYPLIKKEIETFYDHKVDVLDTPGIVANRVKNVLEYERLLATNKKAEDVFVVSDITESFQKTAEIFYGKRIELKKKLLR